MNIRNPFRKDLKPVSVIDVFRNDPTPPSAWSRLQALGYTMEKGAKKDGKTEYAFYCNGEIVSEWSNTLTVAESHALREQWAQAELARLESEGE